MSTIAQFLIFLPLTLATLGHSAFLSLSLLLTIHSLIHATMNVFIPGLQKALPFMQVPLQPVFLLLIFNLYTAPWQALLSAASVWESILRFLGPIFIASEGIASLIVLQNLGRNAAALIERNEHEGLDFGLLICCAAAYVLSAWWMMVTYPWAAISPLASTLLGAAITALIFLTLIGFGLRKTNVIESSGMALYLAYNIWLCSEHGDDLHWLEISSSYAPLLENLLPHLQSLLNFIMHTVPKPTLVSECRMRHSER
ncbi:hypothetical protein DL93DRAFT_2089670 [Clavulina sp. PMI_390]|nr:hypothetical protein DL93DRAFT_2089670 [Clavulina sp. PMI_390]